MIALKGLQSNFAVDFYPLMFAVTVRDIIKDNGFKYLNARKIQNLSEIQVTIRYNYACSLLRKIIESIL